MRQLTIKLIDEAIFNEFEVTTSLDDLRYLDGTFVLTPELTFHTSVVMLASTNLHYRRYWSNDRSKDFVRYFVCRFCKINY